MDVNIALSGITVNAHSRIQQYVKMQDEITKTTCIENFMDRV